MAQQRQHEGELRCRDAGPVVAHQAPAGTRTRPGDLGAQARPVALVDGGVPLKDLFC